MWFGWNKHFEEKSMIAGWNRSNFRATCEPWIGTRTERRNSSQNVRTVTNSLSSCGNTIVQCTKKHTLSFSSICLVISDFALIFAGAVLWVALLCAVRCGHFSDLEIVNKFKSVGTSTNGWSENKLFFFYGRLRTQSQTMWIVLLMQMLIDVG